MTRILFFMTTSSGIGGIEIWLNRLCQYLSQKGFEPIVGLVRGATHNDPDRFKALYPNLNCVEIDGRGLDRHGRVLALMRCIKAIKPDMVFPLGIVDANEATIRRKQRGEDIRLMIGAHGNIPEMLADLRTYRDWINMAICPGRLAMNTLIEWAGFDPLRMRHVPNGSDRPTTEHVPRADGAPLRLAYIGRMTRKDKRAFDLINLHHELTDSGLPCQLEIVGDGPMYEEIKNEIGNAKNVKMHGALQHDDVYERILPNLDVLLLFSSSESFGIVIAEAMMHSVVPVTSQFVGLYSERLNIDGETGLTFPIGDVNSAAERIKQLYHQPELLVRLSNNGITHSQQFTWEACLNGWVQALNEAAAQPSVVPIEPFLELSQPRESRLTKLGISANVVDFLRRARRATIGSAVPPGGEEWPLFHSNHPPSTINEIQSTLIALEEQARKRQETGVLK